MTATGTSVTRVSDLGWDPAWSPDGRQIVCSTARVEPTTVRLPDSELWVVDVHSGHKRRLLDGPAYQPQWSPSGTRIVFFGPDAEGQRDLWTVAPTGGDPVRLTADRYLDWNPVWSADGRFLYFLSDRGGTMNAWRMRIAETTGRPLDVPRPFTLPATNVMYLARAAGSDALTWSSRFGGGMIRRYELDPARVTDGASRSHSHHTRGRSSSPRSHPTVPCWLPTREANPAMTSWSCARTGPRCSLSPRTSLAIGIRDGRRTAGASRSGPTGEEAPRSSSSTVMAAACSRW